jgi:hypothetical protein
MKAILSFSTIISISFLSHAVHFRTIGNGNWNNTTTVWSTNGITPCGCAPGFTLSSDTITINHPVNLTAHLTATASSKLQINVNGSLTNSLFDVTIANSVLLANGSMNIKKLTVQSGASLAVNNSVLILNGPTAIYGQLNSSFSSIYLLSGNLDVFSAGNFQVTNYSTLQFTNGNLRNQGNVNLCSTCCIVFDKGGITNENTGTMTGDGAAITYNGTIKNFGVWDVGIDYCSSGNDIGMPLAENCTSSNAICLNSPLALFINSFTVTAATHTNNLQWETSDESSVNHYCIEKSLDGMAWNLIIRIAPELSDSFHALHHWQDINPSIGTTVYRLSAVNNDSDTIAQRMASTFRSSADDLLIYPNPTEGIVTIHLDHASANRKVFIYSIYGTLMSEQNWPIDQLNMTISLPYPYGIYFIGVVDDRGSRMVKIRKTGE